MQVEILANPNSGRGAGPGRAQRIATRLRAMGCTCSVHVGQGALDAMRWASNTGVHADRLVVVGGDGTLNSVVQGIVSKGLDSPPIALAALGTANLLAHELRLPRHSRGISELVLGGEPKWMDCARLRLIGPGGRPIDRWALLVCGFGLDGELMRRMEAQRDGPIRKRQYFGLLRRILAEWSSPPQRVIADGQDLGVWPYAILTGIRTYAMRWLRLPAGPTDDGRWELMLFPRVSRSALLRMVTAAALRRVDRLPGVVVRSVQEVRFETEAGPPAPVQIDGDYAGNTDVEFFLEGPRIPILQPRRRRRDS